MITERLRLSGDRVTAAELASELNVTKKTIERDVNDLITKEGWLIDGKKGSQGGYLLLEKPKVLRHLKLNHEQIFFLGVVRRIMESYKGTPMTSRMNQVLNRIVDLYGDLFFQSTEGLEGKMFIKTFGQTEMKEDVWYPVFLATLEERRLEVVSQKVREGLRKVKRVLEPHAVVFQDHGWYVIAKDLGDDLVKNFGIWRFTKATMLEDGFTPPPIEEIRSRVEESAGVDAGEESYEVKLRIDSRKGIFIKERSWFKDQKFSEDEEGRTLMSFRAKGARSTLGWILEMGDYVEILEPKWLRDTIAGIGKRIYENNS